MGIKSFNLYCFFIGGFLIYFLYFILLSGWDNEVGFYSDFINFFGVYLYVDNFSFYLSLLVLILFICLIPLIGSYISISSLLLLGFTGMSSIICFVVGNSLLFWIFYESAIIIILFLLYIDSPYSERFLAGWYLLGYSIFSGLPLIWGFCCFSLWSGSFLFIDWSSLDTIWLFIILGFLFTTKIPFAPFHVWLPIVHAEASTPVSVCLSGYIMKLGIIGALRVIFFFIPDSLFINYYVCFVFLFSIFCFFSAIYEIDGKRWLALLSLSHIGIALLAIISISEYSMSGSSIFCYSHGLSSAYLFIYFWYLCGLGGSRNLLYISWSINGALYSLIISIVGFCYVASFPPSLSFFIELWVLAGVSNISYFFVFLLILYLLFGSLIPIILFGSLYIRRLGLDYYQNYNFNYFLSFLLLLMLSIILVVS
uniref:NADH-ubiquinone oxidoreductase chain 4 n=1 Tax=Sphyranura euryceae TaxID=2996394 RepID=A0AA51UC52_9PLAT|nr:NADH dehydrogenase subunit 4 [Sphyranura euryceae]WMV02084.1 NADH dehydrogenase subunit 4 [Sphyranura euryceae]